MEWTVQWDVCSVQWVQAEVNCEKRKATHENANSKGKIKLFFNSFLSVFFPSFVHSHELPLYLLALLLWCEIRVKIYCILIWFHKLHKVFASTSTKMWLQLYLSLSLALSVHSSALACTVSWTGSWRVEKPQECLRHRLDVLLLRASFGCLCRCLSLPVWPFCMTIMYEHKNVPYSPRCRQPKLPQFVAVYNLATHQSMCARQAKKKEKPLQTSQDNVVTPTKLEK